MTKAEIMSVFEQQVEMELKIVGLRKERDVIDIKRMELDDQISQLNAELERKKREVTRAIYEYSL